MEIPGHFSTEIDRPTLAADALKSNLVRAPLPERVTSGEFYWLATSAVRPPSANIRVFARWLRAELATDCVVWGPCRGGKRRK